MATEEKLELFKKKYEELSKRYGLPDFRFMNENFEIESLAEEETDILIRKIRKNISERIVSLIRLLEAFQNPSNSPMFIFNIIKSFNEEDKEKIAQLYKKLNEYDIEIFSLDVEYNEEKEVSFIKKFCESWKDVQLGLKNIEKAMRKSSGIQGKAKERSYFGQLAKKLVYIYF